MQTAVSKSPAQSPTSRPGDNYEDFLGALRENFANYAPDTTGPLFTTDATSLFDLFLEYLPPEARQHYNCHSCRKFVDTFGGLVFINEHHHMVSAFWNTQKVPSFFVNAVMAVAHRVSRANITGVFVASTAVLGHPVTGPWCHMAVTLPASRVHKSVVKTAHQVAAEKREEFNMLGAGINEFPLAAVEQAITLLKADLLYRSEKCLGVAEWLKALHEHLAATKNERTRQNILWLAVATAPAGFCHVRSTMIGTLLEDIVAGLPFDSIAARFAAKMHPLQYQRPQAAPTAGNIAQAEKIIEQLKAAGALERRYARLEEIETIWKPTLPSPVAPATGVFAHLAPKPSGKKATPVKSVEIPPVTMTWRKFMETILPSALTIQAKTPTDSNRFAALVTAQNSDAAPILQWDSEEARNPVSWYYHAGIDAEMRRRVVKAGGQYDGVEIRATLIWGNRNDLDLHCMTPGGEHIYYGNKRARCGGWLDVDMNVRGETTEPVENIRWLPGSARVGRYQFYVYHYRFHEPYHGETPYSVELEVNGKIYRYDGVLPSGQTQISQPVFEFSYVPGREVQISAQSTNINVSGWGLESGTFVDVTGIANSPNLWGESPKPQHGSHIFFLLKGCHDESQGKGRGFFTEMLRSEYREVRATLEFYMASSPIAGAEQATACGIGMTNNSPWNLHLRVKSAIGVSDYIIDRWD
jgi:hypothetical protein